MAEARRALLYANNLLPKIQLQGKSPYELFTRHAKPSLSEFSFGQDIVYWQHRMKLEKLDPLGQRGRYLSAMSQIAHSVPGAHLIWCLARDDVVIVLHVKPYGVCAMLLPRTLGGTGVQGSVRGANGPLAGLKSDTGGGATVTTRESQDNADPGATAHLDLRGPAQDGAGTTEKNRSLVRGGTTSCMFFPYPAFASLMCTRTYSFLPTLHCGKCVTIGVG